jgi:CHASE3 domain sensor protein
MKLKLHYTYKLPGDIEQPSLMTIINEKLDLVERLNKLIDGRASQSESVKQIKEMIKIEMDAIYEMIQVDKKEEESKPTEFEF